MDFFGELIKKIEKLGFAPLAPLQQSKSSYTLHNVIYDQIGIAARKQKTVNELDANTSVTEQKRETHITADDADVVFWDYKKVREYLELIDQIVNEGVSAFVGTTTNAIGWAHEPGRTQAEIISLLTAIRTKHPDLPPPPVVIRRPQIPSMIQKTIVEGAIGNTLAVLGANGMGYGDLFELIANLNLSNESLLDELDRIILVKNFDRTVIDLKSKVPCTLIAAYFKFRDSSSGDRKRNPTITDFLEKLNSKIEFTGASDEVLLARLGKSNNDES
jgi:tetrahydromethanopterin S-methyltransferase subunit B